MIDSLEKKTHFFKSKVNKIRNLKYEVKIMRVVTRKVCACALNYKAAEIALQLIPDYSLGSHHKLRHYFAHLQEHRR